VLANLYSVITASSLCESKDSKEGLRRIRLVVAYVVSTSPERPARQRQLMISRTNYRSTLPDVD